MAEITSRSAQNQDHPRAHILEERLMGIVQVMEEALKEQQAAFDGRDFMDLDVRMEVLAERLRKEGL